MLKLELAFYWLLLGPTLRLRVASVTRGHVGYCAFRAYLGCTPNTSPE
jgi:hypothetical protein